MSDSDSDDDYLKSKKPRGVRGCRGLKKKSTSTDSSIEIPLASNSHVYSSKVSRCFGHMNAHDYDEELQQAEQETIQSDVEDDLLTSCHSTVVRPAPLPSDILTLSDDEDDQLNTINSQKTPSKPTAAGDALSPSPPPPPSPPSTGSAGKSRRGGRRHNNRAIKGKRKLLKSVSNLTKDICSARRYLTENTVQTSFASPDGDTCVIDPDDEVTVRIQFQGEIRRFAINTDQPFSVIMEELARTEEVAFSHVMLVHKDKILRPTDTPTSIDLHTADIIMCHINENLNSSLNNTHEVDDPNLIELCVQSKTSRRREIIKIHPRQPLQVLMEEYSRRAGTTASSLHFWFDGEIISQMDTPDVLDMEDGDCLDVNYLTEIILD